MSYTLTLEPSTATWSGPQRLALKVTGETIADVEYRPSFRERSLASLANRRAPAMVLRELTRSCPSCGQAHGLAFCQAIESLLAVSIPERAAYLRVALVELERASAHLGALEEIFASMGSTSTAANLNELKATTLKGMAILAGDAHSEPLLLPGGLSRDFPDEKRSELRHLLTTLNRALLLLANKLIEQRLILVRTVEVGVLSQSAASQFMLSGPMARASGIPNDLRRDQPYAAYTTLQPQLISQESGDVYARIVGLLLEAVEALKLADRALLELPDGAYLAKLPNDLPAGTATGIVEAPRGTLTYTVESDGRRISNVSIQPAPQLDRLLARALLVQANLDDVVLIALSTNPCTACAELRTT